MLSGNDENNVKRIHDFILDCEVWKRKDLEYEKKLDPHSYRTGFDAGCLNAFFLILDFIDFLEIERD